MSRNLVLAIATMSLATTHPAVADPSDNRSGLGWYANVGGAWLPSGIDGPGDITAEVLEGGLSIRRGKNEARLGAIAALESTYYQSSTSGFVELRSLHYFVPAFSVGTTLGFGIGSFASKGTFNADNGTSPQLVGLGGFQLHVGPRNQVEIGFEVGAVYLTSFSELDPFYEISIGVVR